MILIKKDLWDMIKHPETSETSIKESKKALAIISLSISNSELVYLTKCTTATEAWTKLAKTYEPKGIMRCIFLRRKLLSIRFEKGRSIQEHINCITQITQQLRAINAPVNDEDIAITLLINLPESYDGLITALEIQAKDLTLHHVQTILLQEEARRKEKVSDGKAFTAKKNAKAYNKKADKGSTTLATQMVVSSVVNPDTELLSAESTWQKKNRRQK